jgi:polyphosphate kinase
VLPVISPLGLDPAHPFPRLVNKSLNFILSLEGKDAFGRDSGLAIVPAPRSLPRLIKVPKLHKFPLAAMLKYLLYNKSYLLRVLRTSTVLR